LGFADARIPLEEQGPAEILHQEQRGRERRFGDVARARELLLQRGELAATPTDAHARLQPKSARSQPRTMARSSAKPLSAVSGAAGGGAVACCPAATGAVSAGVACACNAAEKLAPNCRSTCSATASAMRAPNVATLPLSETSLRPVR